MPQASRRAFLRGKSPQQISHALRPPWAVVEAEFTRQCSRCDDCIEQCPQHILQRGDGGFPEINFQRGECTFCGRCTEVCQADAFMAKPHSPQNAWNLAVDILPSCLSLNAVVCRSCGDCCETRAIRFRLQTGAVAIPEIDASKCTGCGACLFTCPVNAVSIKNAIPERVNS